MSVDFQVVDDLGTMLVLEFIYCLDFHEDLAETDKIGLVELLQFPPFVMKFQGYLLLVRYR